jgi:hypothetical protein
MSRSTYTDHLVLKGGVLLAAFGQRRPTRDIDLQASALSNDADIVRAIVCEVASIDVDDGVGFETAGATAVVIRDDDTYSGVRVSMGATLLPARLRFHVDLNVGDPITPAPQPMQLPRLLGGTITVRGYPLAMIHAEKVVTAVTRGTANTRWRDFADIYLLTRQHAVDGNELHQAIENVAAFRHATLAPLAQVLAGYGDIAQAKWSAWRRKQQLDDRLPELFDDVLKAVVAFADPIITGTARARRWDPKTATWR